MLFLLCANVAHNFGPQSTFQDNLVYHRTLSKTLWLYWVLENINISFCISDNVFKEFAPIEHYIKRARKGCRQAKLQGYYLIAPLNAIKREVHILPVQENTLLEHTAIILQWCYLLNALLGTLQYHNTQHAIVICYRSLPSQCNTQTNSICSDM